MDDLAEFATRRPRTRWAGHPIVLKAQTGSTNDDVREAALTNAATGFTVVADTQTAGRGRRGRTWLSPPGENLYVSVLARPALSPADAPLITLAAGLAVRDAVLACAAGSDVAIKWPNDVRIAGRKIAGVLVEGSIRGSALGFVVVGVGINVRGTELPPEITATATTLRLATGITVARGELLERLLIALERRIDALVRDGAASTVGAVSACCDTLGTRVRIDELAGVADSISPSGGLIIRCDDGALREARAGEAVTLAAAD
jgi:BirA family biotin operon repressor/biotin-[acetyl-CoA-carboxylase] ligase